MKKTYQEIFNFVDEAYNYVSGDGGKTKLGYAISKLIGNPKLKKPGKLSDVISEYYESLEDIHNECASTDDKKNILKDESGNKMYTAESLKNKRAKEKSRFDTAFSGKTTTDLNEGINLYYTTARFNSAFALKTTTDLGEGINLYFTNARAITALTGQNISLFANDSGYITGVIGTANRITVTGGNTIDISSSYIGQNSITTLGTISTGVWQGTSISTTYTDAKIKGSIAATSGLIAYGNSTLDTVTSNTNFRFDSTNTGLIVGTTALVATNDITVFRKDQNARTGNFTINATSGNGSFVSMGVSTSATLSTAVTVAAFSAAWTTSGILVANAGVISSTMAGGLNLGTSGATQVSLWTNNIKRIEISNVGIATYTSCYKVLAVGTAAANTSPIKFTLTSAAVLTTPEAGALEADTNGLLYTTSVGTTRSTINRTLFTQTASTTVTNTTTETTILGTGIGTKTIKNNDLIIGRTIRVYVAGVYSTPISGAAATIKIKIGTTVVAQVTTTALLSSASGLRFEGWVDITVRTTGSSGTVMVSGGVNYTTGLSGQIATDSLNNGGSTTTVNTTADRAIDITVTWDTADSGKIVTSTNSSIELLN
jgi:hypothetical protein